MTVSSKNYQTRLLAKDSPLFDYGNPPPTKAKCFGQDHAAPATRRPKKQTAKDKAKLQEFIERLSYLPGTEGIALAVNRGVTNFGEALDRLNSKKKSERLSINPHAMKALLALPEEVLTMAKLPNARVETLIAHIREQIQEIENPHQTLERELAQLVEAQRPPNGEFYKTRADKSELVVTFFQRVYGRFHEAGVIYKHQLRQMDRVLYDNLSKTRHAPNLPKKVDFINKDLERVSNFSPSDLARLSIAAQRRKKVT